MGRCPIPYKKEEHMTTSTIASQPGLKGTLSAEQYTTRTAPFWGETYVAAIAKYADMDYVSIAFATDADKAAVLIPKELELIPIPGGARTGRCEPGIRQVP